MLYYSTSKAKLEGAPLRRQRRKIGMVIRGLMSQNGPNVHLPLPKCKKWGQNNALVFFVQNRFPLISLLSASRSCRTIIFTHFGVYVMWISQSHHTSLLQAGMVQARGLLAIGCVLFLYCFFHHAQPVGRERSQFLQAARDRHAIPVCIAIGYVVFDDGFLFDGRFS